MQIDCYGFDATSTFFQRRKLLPYRVESGDVIYLCYDNSENRPIHRITKNGNETVFEWAYGKWDERTQLTYVPINQTLEV